MNMARRLWDKVNQMVEKIDSLPLWWLGLFLVFIVLLPNLSLGTGSVFTIHDQWDESLMNYVLTARHPGEGSIPEMLGGIQATGLEPSAVLFVPLYRIFPAYTAFFISYIFMLGFGFAGMYAIVKELTESSILALVMAGIFCMLPLYPVYGLSQMGIPLILYAALCLFRKKRVVPAFLIVLVFGLSSHLVYTGYVVLGFWVLALMLRGFVLRKKENGSGKAGGLKGICLPLAGFLVLLLTYLVSNYALFAEILLGRGGYVTHREEMVNASLPFGKTVWNVFLHSAQHGFTYQEKLIVPIVVSLILGGVCYRRFQRKSKQLYGMAVCGWILLFLIAVFYGVCKSAPVVAWKNSVTGFLHYFQMERVYWLYPAGWYLEFALCASYWWQEKLPGKYLGKAGLLKCMILGVVLLPAMNTVLHHSYFYMNVNQYNNGSEITGLISWEEYYAEDLMEQIDEAIGREKSEYRIAHLGISPAPALMHGFYTVDGYSNNYPLEYKHRFRQVIAKECELAPETAVYFDTWGNRCYLFNSLTGTYWMLEKGSEVCFENLQFDMEALGDLGCEYLLSGGEILDYDRMGLEPMGYFETPDSYWGIWLYRLL